ncbi:MAG: hypothetical protein WD604_10985 [Balneolaceae bacterium]
MGDSMAQGFKNGGIYRTDLSFPALLARSMGNEPIFEMPSFTAQAGIPINMEILVRGLEEEFGDEITFRNSIRTGREVYTTLRRIKSYWDGHLRSLKTERNKPFHNQAVWGFSISDTWLMNEKYCRTFISENKARYSVFNVLPDNAMYTTARLVFNPSFTPAREENSMVDNILELAEDGGIENLIVCIGHNNIVGAVTKLEIVFSEETDVNKHYADRKCTVFRPEHFEKELRILYKKFARKNIKRVFVPTLPYVTIPPAIRGVNGDRSEPTEGYYDYYARFWIWDEDFNPEKHPHLTREDAILLDQIVDEYNEIIKKLAGEFGFHVVPVDRYVRAAARRRRGKDLVKPFPPEFVSALQRNKKTSYLVDEEGMPRISTDYIRIGDEDGKIERGGIFSLDGLHPSTIGYGLMANIYRLSMKKQGVKFDHPLDWDFIIKNETLITDPPFLLHDLRRLLRYLALGRQERLTLFGKNMLQQVLEMFSARPETEVKNTTS